MINQFISEIKTKGLARLNRYEVEIAFPNGIGGAGGASNLTKLFCDSVNLPGLNINTQPHIVFGEAREMPYGRMFDPVNMSFYVDTGLVVKSVFDKWLALIVDEKSRTINYYNNYVTQINIRVLNVDDSNPYTMTLHDAYPKTVNAIQLDASAKDVMKLNVTFAYKYWTKIDNATSGGYMYI